VPTKVNVNKVTQKVKGERILISSPAAVLPVIAIQQLALTECDENAYEDDESESSSSDSSSYSSCESTSDESTDTTSNSDSDEEDEQEEDSTNKYSDNRESDCDCDCARGAAINDDADINDDIEHYHDQHQHQGGTTATVKINHDNYTPLLSSSDVHDESQKQHIRTQLRQQQRQQKQHCIQISTIVDEAVIEEQPQPQPAQVDVRVDVDVHGAEAEAEAEAVVHVALMMMAQEVEEAAETETDAVDDGLPKELELKLTEEQQQLEEALLPLQLELAEVSLALVGSILHEEQEQKTEQEQLMEDGEKEPPADEHDEVTAFTDNRNELHLGR
jgi:hypothetical protein